MRRILFVLAIVGAAFVMTSATAEAHHPRRAYYGYGGGYYLPHAGYYTGHRGFQAYPRYSVGYHSYYSGGYHGGYYGGNGGYCGW